MPVAELRTRLAETYVAFSAAWRKGLDIDGQSALWRSFASFLPVVTETTKLPFLSPIPVERRWTGGREVKSTKANSFSVTTYPWELTLGVPRIDIVKDTTGWLTPKFEELGQRFQTHPTRVTTQALIDAGSTTCYDGTAFFGASHPTDGVDTANGTYANQITSGSLSYAYAMDLRHVAKPIIYAQLEAPTFSAMTSEESSDHVFRHDEYLYGAKSHDGATVGLPQYCVRFDTELLSSNDSWSDVLDLFSAMRDHQNQPLDAYPTAVMIPRAREVEFKQFFQSALVGGGNTNIFASGAPQIIINPYLPATQ